MVGRPWVRSLSSWAASCVVLSSVGLALHAAVTVRKTASDLPQELAAAQREGIVITTHELIAASQSDPSHNAAPLYDDAIKLFRAVPSNDRDACLQGAASVLEGGREKGLGDRMLRFGPALEKALLASVRTDCTFSPIWSQGSGYPQLKPLSAMTRLLAARAAIDGDLADLFAAVRMTGHIGQCPVLEGEQQQALAIEAVSKAAWIVAKRTPSNALTCRTLLEELPGIQLDHRVSGELQRSLSAIESLSKGHPGPLSEVAGMPGSPQMSDAYKTEVVRSLRAIHQLTKDAATWDEIEDGLANAEMAARDDRTLTGQILSTVVGPWVETAKAARRAQEKLGATVQAIHLLEQKQPDGSKGSDKILA